MQRQHLQKLSREELIREAERAGVSRPRVLTTTELIDEILKRTAGSDRDRSRARGWLGRARDLLATVVEKGLHLPDAAAAIRSGPKGWPPPPPPLATVTLAEIYAAQGHLERAVGVLDEVLEREPDHQEAAELRERFLAQLARGSKAPSDRPAPQAAAKPAAEEAAASRDEDEDEDEERSPEVNEEKNEEGVGGDALPPSKAPVTLEAVAPAPQGLATVAAPEEAAVSAAISEEETTAAPAAPEAGGAEDARSAAGAGETEARIGEEEAPATKESAELEDAARDAALETAAALPERYDVDEVVALAVDPSTFYVYWEVRPTTFAQMVSRQPTGSLVLRVMAVTPGWEGPIVETRDVRIDALYGDHFIHHVRPRADVRVSIGWATADHFDPIAVGAEVSAPRAFVAAGSPGPGGRPVDLSEGPHGPRDLRRTPAAFASRTGERAAERLAAGLAPRELWGSAMENAPVPGGAAAGPAGWIWAPLGGEAGADMPFAFGPSGAEVVSDSGQPLPAAVRWGGASEGVPTWGGASERAPTWGGASESAPR